MGWLQTHLEEFVKPVLGFIPEVGKDYNRLFSPQEMAIIKNMWRSVKREAKRLNKPILLAGRDVFIFEILARREGTPTVFRPDISRLTASKVQEDYSQYFLFDTGFMGSIPRTLRCESFTMGSSNKVGVALTSWGSSKYLRLGRKHPLLTTDTQQVFPRMKGARSLILKIERTPKYWRRAFYRKQCKCQWPEGVAFAKFNPCWFCGGNPEWTGPEGIGQDLADKEEFLKAALLTIEIYKDSSPAFSDGPVEVTGIYGAGYTD